MKNFIENINLYDCCEILDSQRVPITSSERKTGPYPYYGANGIQDYVADYLFDDELVLLAEDGGNFGSKTRPIAYRVSGKCWVNNHAHVLKPKPGIDVDYLCYSLMYYDVGGLVNGATRKKLTQAAMRQIQIPYRLPATQQQIVHVLNAITDLIKQYDKEILDFDTLIKARFVEMFGDPVINSLCLSSMPMTELCEIIDGDRGKNYPKQEEFFAEGDCLFLNAKNVTSNGFVFKDCSFITKEKDRLLNKGKLKRGDVVLTTRGTIGNLAFYGNEVPYENVRINSGMVILRMNHSLLSEMFFIEQFRIQLQDIKTKIASGSAQPQLPISAMKNIKMVIAPLTLQEQFAAFVSEVDKSKAVVQKALDEAQLLFDSLMQEYFG